MGIKLGNFTVIYGESDVGKSALYRAVRAVVTAESGDAFISEGTGRVGVAIKLSSGEVINYRKQRGRSCEYDVKMPDAPPVVWKRNKKLPGEIAQRLRFAEIVVDGDKFYPNLRGQFDGLFLLSETTGKRARVLGTLISNILLRAIKQSNVERNRNEADVRSLEGMIEDLKASEEFDWDDFVRKIEAEKKIVNKLQRADELYEEIQGLVQKRTTLEKLAKKKITFLPKKVFTELEELVSLHEELGNLVVSRNHGEGTLARLQYETDVAEAGVRDTKKRMEELKKKMFFNCPHCGKPINRSEIEDD